MNSEQNVVCAKTPVRVRNPHIKSLSVDHLYHIALDTSDINKLETLFGDVKFVCFGGSPSRMEGFVDYINRELGLNENGHCPQNYAAGTDRYCVYKAGPVLSVSHGIGMPSLSVVFNEIVKLMHYAKCRDVTFFRIGTSGGIGVEPGSVVLTEKAVDGEFSHFYKMFILGKRVERPAIVDEDLIRDLEACGRDDDDFQTVKGTTMCTEDFYECQARLDGAFCDFNEEDKMAFMQTLKDHNICNIEMESLGFLALCRHAGIKGAVACVTLLDRLKQDYITVDIPKLKLWQLRPQMLISRYIKKKIGAEFG
ncbi:Uridine phosphorylase 1 [Mizuhopecten yessoensis]|uniref:Uridine phosphorylase 1 n=1 Tax=Mizuhopecten yessoensis TaxID=6573 RepID=A0A210R1S4_MIZYE|nr:Uridine phosphorylase 1 [Mizuhopecten yessoensis]